MFTFTAHVVGINEPGAPGQPLPPGNFIPATGQTVAAEPRPVATVRIGTFGDTLRFEVPVGENIQVGDDIQVTFGGALGAAPKA